MTNTIEIADGHATLSFCLLGWISDEIAGEPEDHVEFLCSYQDRAFSGVVKSSTYRAEPLTTLFDSMARTWRGWKGEKVWSDLERGLTLVATSDSTGHVSLAVEMRTYRPDRTLRADLHLEAGSLDAVAARMSKFLAPPN